MKYKKVKAVMKDKFKNFAHKIKKMIKRKCKIKKREKRVLQALKIIINLIKKSKKYNDIKSYNLKLLLNYIS